MLSSTCWSRLHNTLSPAIVLLLLVWITPTTAAEPTSYNDPFRALALQAPKPPEPPICCLRPLPSLEPVEDDLLVSFEEWKARQQLTSENISSANLPSNGSNKGRNGAEDGSTSPNVDDTTSPPPAASEDQQPHAPAEGHDALFQNSPRFRIPLVDRFNYASLDCSARLYKAHKGAKHPSNILSSKKDRYMLSPCKTNGEKQFVVIELCEDIRIDTVQIANFEFFSGVFKDFTVSVAKTSWKDDSEEGWTVAGTYKAKNIRGVQSFHPPTSLRDFYRYLRIDFHSHYGSEYFCPVSLVRVFGLTHLEEWKWESWEAESKAKMEALPKDATLSPETLNETSAVGEPSQIVNEEQLMPPTQVSPINEIENDAPPFVTMSTEATSLPTETNVVPTTTQPSESETHPTSSLVTPNSSISITSTHISFAPHPSTDPPNDVTPSITVLHNVTNATSTGISSTPVVITPASSRASSSSIVVTASPLTSPQSFLPVPVSGGESIYRMIMNRLIGLERNHTLYEQYMAQQQQIVREALKRLGEDIGRLEGLGKAQRQAHDRTITEWEKQRRQWQMEYLQLLQRIDYLSDEIVMEKRLGVAQLCLLLAVLVFMGLTRGSRGPVIEDRRYWRSALKSLSGDWRRPKVTRSKEPSMIMQGQRTEYAQSGPGRIMPIAAMDSGSGQSQANTDDFSSGPARYPLVNVDTNVIHHQQLSTGDSDENHHPDHRSIPSIIWNNTGTPSRIRSRTGSGSRSRTLSWQGRGNLLAPGLRQSVDPRGGHAPRGVPVGTPSKGSRVAGVYSPRPTFPSVRANTYLPIPRRPVPMQRSHSSHGSPGSLEYILDQTWIGSGSELKSARRWARTAHLHEVKRKKTEAESAPGSNNVLNGDDDPRSSLGVNGTGSEDVFGGIGISRIRDNGREKEPLRSMIGIDIADTDADGWESTSDVDVDSVEGI